MHYLIDGHNLIAKLAGIHLGDPNDEAELVLLLRRWTAGGKNRKVTVVFDGGLPGGENQILSTSSVKVVFASADRTADDLLITRIHRLGNPAEYTVVTDDRKVVTEGRWMKASLMSSNKFAQSIESVGKQDEFVEDGSNQELSETEIVEWLGLFSGDSPE
ncbi:MAG TPA: NYN domain-containing protein [candidate division Zixibacteria bacterium]|nr:NYN domain-containing protein [candidate division Zixibacteria bacterium]